MSSGETFLKGTEKLPQILNPTVMTQYNKQTEQQQLGKFDNTAKLVNMYTELNITHQSRREAYTVRKKNGMGQTVN